MVVAVMVVTSGAPVWALTRDPWLSVAAVPLLYGLLAAVSGVGATLLGVSVLAVFVPITIVANATAAYVLFCHHTSRGGRQLMAGAAIAVATICGLMPLKAPFLGWDTRTHWLGPARWYYGGGTYVRHALTNHAFAHPTYPPLLAASAGTLWLFEGHIDLRSGQVVISLMNFGAVLMVGLAIPRLFPKMGALPTITAILMVLATFGVAGTNATNGYADLLWAASATAAVAYLLLANPTRVNVGVGSLALAVAGLTKVEGTVFALALVGACAWKYRRGLPRIALVLAAGAVVVVWPVFVRLLGTENEIQGKDVASLLTFRGEIWRRIIPTAGSLISATGGVLIVAALCALIGRNVAGPARERAHIGSSAWVWALVGFTAIALSMDYILATDGLTNHLDSSVERVTIVLRLLLMLDITLWVLCAVRTLANTRHPERTMPSAPSAPDVPADFEAPPTA